VKNHNKRNADVLNGADGADRTLAAAMVSRYNMSCVRRIGVAFGQKLGTLSFPVIYPLLGVQ